jgi:hypothetical protein
LKIEDYFRVVCPLKTASGVQNTPYWSFELGTLHKRARKAWNHRLTDPDAYKNAIKEYTKALRSKKRSSWKDFCGEVDGIQPSARLHRILSKDDDYKINCARSMVPAITIRWVLSNFHQELLPSLIKRLQNTFLRLIFQGVNQSHGHNRNLSQ